MHRLLFIATLLWGSAAAEPLDRVVAVVGDQLVLSSDVDLLTVLATRDAQAMPIWEASLGRAIDTAAVRELAGDVSVYAPRPEQVSSRLDAVRDSFETYESFDAFLENRGMTEKDLSAILRRRLVVEKFIKRNLEVPAEDPAFQAAAAAAFAGARERVVIREIAPKAL
ncbi:MAG: hypothetical protein KC912_07415 [Proteobacteria bacterium]|nr:hypothetical protein [Pseudomonadota bacterium]